MIFLNVSVKIVKNTQYKIANINIYCLYNYYQSFDCCISNFYSFTINYLLDM